MINLIEITAMFDELFKGQKTKVTTDHINVFCVAYEGNEIGELKMSEIHKSLAMNQSKAHRALMALEFAGVVELSRSLDDARQVSVFLTAKGERFAEKVNSLLSQTSGGAAGDIISKVSRSIKRSRRLKHIKDHGDVFFDKCRDELARLLAARGEDVVEVGKNYMKTSRGSVSASVLFKRSGAESEEDLAAIMHGLTGGDYDAFMTPNPKTKVARTELKGQDDE